VSERSFGVKEGNKDATPKNLTLSWNAPKSVEQKFRAVALSTVAASLIHPRFKFGLYVKIRRLKQVKKTHQNFILNPRPPQLVIQKDFHSIYDVRD